MKVAFVMPWFGPDIPGGAESAARRTAERLAAAGYEVEVLTTCIRDLYADWSHNAHPAGLSQHEGVTIRRFPVERRDKAAFDALNWPLMNGLMIPADQEHIFIEEMFRSPELYQFISDRRDDYVFFFTPYMFSSTYFGAQIAPERSAIVPCLHDEPYARLGLYRPVLQNAAALVFFSQAEQKLAHRLLGQPTHQLQVVAGAGVTPAPPADTAEFRRQYDLDAPFILYAGRREAGKNIDLLLDYWRQYVASHSNSLQLVFIGPGSLTIPKAMRRRTRDLGYLPLADKEAAHEAALALCQPSVHESFSLVMMESWLAGRPVLVHGGCAVTLDHTRQANGGLYFHNAREFAACLDYLTAHPTTADQMGQQGRDYVLANFRWDKVVAKYETVIKALA